MTLPEAAFCRAQAIRCARLARGANPREAQILNDMAAEYTARADALGMEDD